MMRYVKMMSLMLLAVVMFNCTDDPAPLPTADFVFEVDELSVTFNGTVTDASSQLWDFGDGNTSKEEDPTHVYAAPGTYAVKFTAIGAGGEDSQSNDVEALPSLSYLLTGGVENADGKSWILNVTADLSNDGSGTVTNDLTIVQPVDDDNLLGRLSLDQAYKDVFTFVHDGTYKIDNSDFNGGSIMSVVYASLNYNMAAFPDGDLLGISLDMDLVPFADIVYTPKTDATWSVSEEDFNVTAVNTTTGDPYVELFSGQKRLVLDEYFGYKDESNVVIIKSITETHMQVAIAFHGTDQAPGLATHLFHLTFIAK